jgi:transcriptional regulator with XRE-family HTH domain
MAGGNAEPPDKRKLSAERKLELAFSGLTYWRRRVSLGIPFDQFCEAAGVSSTALTHLERGYHRVNEAIVSQIDAALTAAEQAEATGK